MFTDVNWGLQWRSLNNNNVTVGDNNETVGNNKKVSDNERITKKSALVFARKKLYSFL